MDRSLCSLMKHFISAHSIFLLLCFSCSCSNKVIKMHFSLSFTVVVWTPQDEESITPCSSHVDLLIDWLPDQQSEIKFSPVKWSSDPVILILTPGPDHNGEITLGRFFRPPHVHILIIDIQTNILNSSIYLGLCFSLSISIWLIMC